MAPESLRKSIADWIGLVSQAVGLGMLIQQLVVLVLQDKADPVVMMAGAALAGIPEWFSKLLRAQRSLERSVELEARELNERREPPSPPSGP